MTPPRESGSAQEQRDRRHVLLHALNNALTPILANVAFVRSYAGEGSEDLREALQDIEAGARRAHQLVTELQALVDEDDPAVQEQPPPNESPRG